MSEKQSFFRRISLPNSFDTRKEIQGLQNLLTLESNATQHMFYGPYNTTTCKRPLHSARTVRYNNTNVWLRSQELVSSVTTCTDQGYRKRISAAGRLIGQRMMDAAVGSPRTIHYNHRCNGCGLDPIVGNLWSCYSCINYNLCDSCYTKGIHGFEKSQLLAFLQEDLMVKSKVARCKSIPDVVFAFLLRRVCKSQRDKFNFLAEWIIQVANGEKGQKLNPRGIEIPRLDSETRKELVEMLMPALANTPNADVNMEWYPTNTIQDNQVDESDSEVETLRIWVADKNGHSKSPFY